MKRFLTILIALCLLAALCACGGDKPAPQGDGQSAANEADQQPQQDAPAAESESGESYEMSEAEIASLDGYANGVPDLSGLTEEEIVARYAADMREEGAFNAYEAALFSPELFYGAEADPNEDGEWTAYDPGDWEPGEDIVAQFDIDWDAEYGGESALPSSDLPEEYAWLLPEGMRSGDLAMEEDGEFILSLSGRSKDDYAAIVQRAKEAGYTQNASEIDTMGIVMYEASDGSRSVTIMFQNGKVMVSFL